MLARDIAYRAMLLEPSRRHDAPRVTCLTIDGVACVLPGLNRFLGDWTMPSRFPIGDAIGREWIRAATAEELLDDPKWWRLLAFMPGSIVHANGLLAMPEDNFGMHGTNVTILHQAPVITWTDVPCCDVGDVSTPR